MFNLRNSDDIRLIKSITGEAYYLRKSPYGFFEQYTFYDENGNEIETFAPYNSDGEIIGFYVYDLGEKVLFEGVIINAEFSETEFYDSEHYN
ncbi:hypothetical protein [Paenibacillus sp. NAIST15-1]|uniref:hypothetical protein n=1 Tax=Paenibacillus sp. NAIST15-1 TaxID=1605994 RepID=UPI00086F111B|nr:hypothetical protein [Paenibacillus sp. NAIST15-1]GAV11445.1 GCN5-related N-acetyltransferase [Paenibacillus sp. NAIST15-1]